MRVLDPGHDYLLNNLDGDEKTRLTFVKRIGEMYPGNEIAYEGTNMQEVIRALIDRCEYVNKQTDSIFTERVIHDLRSALFQLEYRAAVRHKRNTAFLGDADLENGPTCRKCGHVGCRGECRHAGSL